ncbi:MAG: ferritin-like domain-containing protein [Rhizobiaceae bacterium]|nr:ferritin-like domain-containing protein [Rhizobiaceae bacterium]
MSLRDGAARALAEPDLVRKSALTRALAKRWAQGGLSLHGAGDTLAPDRPGRPERPELVSPRHVKKRSLHTPQGRIALIHALAHIELNAVDLALDIIARFATAPVPRSFFGDWLGVADDEARHFGLLCERLGRLGASYGDLPAHDGLWDAAQKTQTSMHARLALVPLILEARGLDVTPSLIGQLQETGDAETAAILSVIYEDEKGHVAVGAKWFRFLCARNGQNPADQFQSLVRANFRGSLKPPFNDAARAAAGLTPSFYRSLCPVSQ